MECEQCGWDCDGAGDEIHRCGECGGMYCEPCVGGHGCDSDDDS